MLGSDGRVVLGGFGLARFTSTSSNSEGTIHNVSAMDTALYKAPEQLEGPADQQSDLYAVGTCLYYALTGVLPFDGSPSDQLFARATSDPVALSARVPDVRPETNNLVLHLLARERADRLGTVDDALKQLAALA